MRCAWCISDRLSFVHRRLRQASERASNEYQHLAALVEQAPCAMPSGRSSPSVVLSRLSLSVRHTGILSCACPERPQALRQTKGRLWRVECSAAHCWSVFAPAAEMLGAIAREVPRSEL